MSDIYSPELKIWNAASARHYLRCHSHIQQGGVNKERSWNNSHKNIKWKYHSYTANLTFSMNSVIISVLLVYLLGSSWKSACWQLHQRSPLFLYKPDFLIGCLLLNTLVHIWWNQCPPQLEWRLLRLWLNWSPGRRPENTFSMIKLLWIVNWLYSESVGV